MLKMDKIFDMSANTYNKTETERFDQLHIKTLENTKRYLNRSDIVLDYGSATGTKAFELAGNVKKIEGIDISAKMIEFAQRRANERKVENVDFAQTTIFDERYKSGSFDVILAFNILHLLEDRQQALQRITELLKPGGLFISTTPCLGEKMAFSTKFQFSLFLLLIIIRVIPPIKRFKFSELEDLIKNRNFQILETENLYQDISSYFIVAKKIAKT